MKTFSSSEILDRFRTALNLTSDTELANYLGIKKATLSNWRTRNSLDWPLLFSFCEHIDLNWLVLGCPLAPPSIRPKAINPPNNDALIVHLDSKLKEKDREIGDLREEIGRLKARIEDFEKEGHKEGNTTKVIVATESLTI